jgi:hypothetical protein
MEIKGCPAKISLVMHFVMVDLTIIYTTTFGFGIIAREPPQRVIALTEDAQEKEQWIKILSNCVGTKGSELMKQVLR